MTTDVTAKHDLAALTDSLKKRLEQCNSQSAKRNGKPLPSLPNELRQDLLNALDLLVSQAQATESQASEPLQGGASTAARDDLSNPLVSAIDESMAAWQAQITSSFHQATTRELNQQLELAAKLTSDLSRQTGHLDEQRQILTAELSQALQWKARVARQRKSLSQHFQEQRQELAATLAAQEANSLAQLEQVREQHQQHIASLQDEIAQAQQHAATLANQLEVQSQTNSQLEGLHAELSELRSQVQIAEAQQRAAEEQLRAAEEQRQAAEEQQRTAEALRNTAEEQRRAAEEQSQAADEQRRAAEEQSQAADEQRRTAEELRQAAEEQRRAAEEQSQAADAQRRAAEEDQQAARAALEELREQQPTAASAEQLTQSTRQLEVLEQQLYDQQLELLDLRSQNSDLASQIAKHQLTASASKPHASFNQESLTWEERKQLILQQLDADADSEQDHETTVVKNLEIEDIINTTQKEIERRDREIGELQSIIEQQSSAREGMAIGAAAIAQMLDADELINQERQKLKDIQREWEDKLRQAEIDLSMERAKLARERTQLETELEQARKTTPSPTVEIEGQTKAQARTRKWLEHLGLKESRKHTPDED